MKKFLAMLLAVAMVFALCACGNSAPAPAESAAPVEESPAVDETLINLAKYEYGTDYVSLYQYMKDNDLEIRIADVTEDPETGFAYIEVNGEQHELGLDFLSRAMVYDITTEGSDFETEDDVYAAWWKLYIQRWNAMLPEIPLYSNEYYDLYNAQIKGVDEFPTNPYWSPASALIDWTSEKADNSIIIGNSTELSGKFRYAAFGGTNPGASDLDVQNMTVGLETVSVTKEGGYQWNDTVVKEHDITENDDGTKTYTVTIYDDLKFSDGSAVTAKDYLAFTMAFSSPVAVQAAGKDHQSGRSIAGFAEFNTYDGTEGSGSKEFAGLHLIDDYTFSVTISADYLPYFYDVTYASFSAMARQMWIGDADILDDGNGCYFTDDFYAKEGDSYVLAQHIVDTSLNTDDTYPYSGPYCVASYDDTDKSAVLTLNPYFKGNYEGTTPSIEKVVYKKIISKTQLEDLKSGNLDCVAGITGGDETNEAIALADGSNGAYVYTHYSRAGYGKLGFRADYGPAQFTEVRQAIAYCMDRATFAKDFTGGYGGVTDGPYYTGSWMYKAATAQGMLLNAYDTSVDAAIALLEEGGWVYNAEGGEYTEGVRYKRIAGEYATEYDKTYKSFDGAYTTVEIDGDYYMPLVLNWFGTVDNEFSDLLVTGFEQADNVKAAGFAVQKTTGDFAPMLDELYQASVYGYYSGTPMFTCFNFATGFTSAVYDYSWNMTIDPSMYDNYSAYYIKDMADIYWLG